jgi:hypothetical protein
VLEAGQQPRKEHPMQIEMSISVESRRHCGYRSAGKNGVGIYLVGKTLIGACGRLPIALDICPTCGHGIKFTRGVTRFAAREFLRAAPEQCACPPEQCDTCVCSAGAGAPDGHHMLLWVGEATYRTADLFAEEAQRMGVSRKLSAVPHWMKFGTTWCYLAHKRACNGQPGLFLAFKPSGLDLVVDNIEDVPTPALRMAQRHDGHARIIQVQQDPNDVEPSDDPRQMTLDDYLEQHPERQ